MRRLRRLLCRVVMQPEVPTVAVAAVQPNERPKDLGPKQIAWLRANIKSFKAAKKSADRARAHAEEVHRRMYGEETTA